MTKVKIIDTMGADILEEKVNSFIKDKNIISIKYQTTYPGFIGTGYSAMIVYKEGEE